jgi:hypothetical protein
MLPLIFLFITLIAPGADPAARAFLAALVDLTVVYSLSALLYLAAFFAQLVWPIPH